MEKLIRAMSVLLLFATATLAGAEPPTEDALDIPIAGILRRKTDVLATNAVGIFRADLMEKKWQKLTMPAQMPTGGKFAAVPAGSPHVLYYAKGGHGQKAGLYDSIDAGKSWRLLSEADDYGPVQMLENEAIFAVTNAMGINGKPTLKVSHDMGKTWRDITSNRFGWIISLFPDPDHAGQICVLTNTVRLYVHQAEDEQYDWKATRSWDWEAKQPDKQAFHRWYGTSAINNPLYVLQATIRNYFDYDFADQVDLNAIDLTADQEHFTFIAGEPISIPVTIRFLEDLRAREWHRKQRMAAGYQDPEITAIVEKLVDHPTDLGLWGLTTERGGKSVRIPPARHSEKRKARAKQDEAAAPGNVPAELDEAWQAFELSSTKPYRRTVNIDKLHDFSQPGEYLVQMHYSSTGTGDREQGHWVGDFSSPVFKVTIRAKE
jgi:hypothetical protein